MNKIVILNQYLRLISDQTRLTQTSCTGACAVPCQFPQERPENSSLKRIDANVRVGCSVYTPRFAADFFLSVLNFRVFFTFGSLISDGLFVSRDLALNVIREGFKIE